MQYRPLANDQEWQILREISRLAFNISPDEMQWWQEHSPVAPESGRALFDDEGNMLVGMRIIPEGALYFRTHEPVPAALITSVASPPEQRRKGYIKELFLAMYNEQREQGVALTALYPFYFPFYRSFGYELAHDAVRYVIKTDQFKQWRKAADHGKFVPASHDNKEDLQKMQAMYDAWARRNLGAADRRGNWWFWKMTHNRQFVPAYIYYNPAGEASGYIIYHLKEKGDWDSGNWWREMVIHDMQYLDRQAEEAIYGFIYNHDSQASKVALWLPVDAQFASRIPNPRDAEAHIHAGYMLRLLDVVEAFRQRRFVPEAEGAFTFSVTDEMFPANNGTYRVQVRDGRAEAEKLPDGAEAGVQTDIRAISQLYGGYTSPLQAVARGQIGVSSQADLHAMQAVLSPPGQPAPYMADDF